MLNILLKLKSNVCKYKFFVTSITLVLLFYYPALIYPKLTSYLFAGDNFMLWWPQLINVISNFGEYNFYGFDMSTFGGSSEFFLRPNIMVYNPALIFASIFHSKLLTFDSIIFLAVLFFMFFSFLSVYFAQKLMYEHLNLEYVLSLFIAIGYTFSFYTVNYHNMFVFVFSGWLIPVCVYMSIQYMRNKSFFTLLLGSLSFITLYTSGYLTFSVFNILIILVFLFYYIYSKNLYKNNFFIIFYPLLISSVIVFPYYLSVLEFNKLMPSDWGLTNVAHIHGDSPLYIFRVISESIVFIKGGKETWFTLGLPLITVFIIFLITVRKNDFFKNEYFLLFSICSIFWVTFYLISLGDSSVLSDLFYYFGGPLGKMHIFQRYFLSINFFVMISFALMIYFSFNTIKQSNLKILLLLMVSLTIISSFLIPIINHKFSGFVFIKPDLIFSLILLIIFLLGFIIYGSYIAKWILIFIIFLLPLNNIYDKTKPSFEIENKNKSVILNNYEDRQLLKNYINNNSKKELKRIINIVPDFVTSYVPKNYAWIYNAQNKEKISSYYGYELHISSPIEYRGMFMNCHIPVGSNKYSFFPSIEYLRNTGAEFIIYDKEYEFNDEKIMQYVDLDSTKQFSKSNIAISKLKFPKSEVEDFNNGYVKVSSAGNITVDAFNTNHASKTTIKIQSDQETKVSLLFWPSIYTNVKVNGEKINYTTENNLVNIIVPRGLNTIDFGYSNYKVNIFLLMYASFIIILLSFIIYTLFKNLKINK
tara:strand:+ start:1471 stop:3744 length:2274 start_codon:yes stop_codon:yes gene_type:complete